jgi:hypothetical protein
MSQETLAAIVALAGVFFIAGMALYVALRLGK